MQFRISTSLVFFGLTFAAPSAEARSLTAGSWVAHAVASQLAVSSLSSAARLQARARALPPVARRSRRSTRRVRRRHRRGFVQLTRASGLTVRRLDRAWGRKLTVNRIKQVLADFAARFPGAPPVEVHDLSRPWGGRMKPHKSHRNGRDVDIRIVLKRQTKRYVNATPRTVSVERMWFMVKRFVDSCDVEFIFLDRRLQRVLYRHAKRQGVARSKLSRIFQYPYRRASGIIRHAKGHANHIHVRFRHSRGKFRNYSATAYCKERQRVVEALDLI